MTSSECSPFITDFKGTATCTEIQTGQQWDKPEDVLEYGVSVLTNQRRYTLSGSPTNSPIPAISASSS